MGLVYRVFSDIWTFAVRRRETCAEALDRHNRAGLDGTLRGRVRGSRDHSPLRPSGPQYWDQLPVAAKLSAPPNEGHACSEQVHCRKQSTALANSYVQPERAPKRGAGRLDRLQRMHPKCAADATSAARSARESAAPHGSEGFGSSKVSFAQSVPYRACVMSIF